MHRSKKDGARITREMADYMLANGENCTRDTLLLQFTQAEIDTYSDQARSLANEHQNKAA